MRKLLLMALILLPACNSHKISPEALSVAERYMSDCDFSLYCTPARYAAFPVFVDESIKDIKIIAQESKTYTVGVNTATHPKEIAYDSFEFENYIQIFLKAGENAFPESLKGILCFGFVTAEGLKDEGVRVDVSRSEKFTDLILKASEHSAFRKHPYTEWHYANGATLDGLLFLAEVSGSRQMIDHIRKQCDFTLDNLPVFKASYDKGRLRAQNYRMFRQAMLDDTGAAALPYIDMALRAYEHKELMGLLDTIAVYIMERQYRLDDGTFTRPEPKWTVWCDDMFMACSFLTRYYDLTGDRKYLDECVKQAEQFYNLLSDTQTGLLYHAYNNGHIGAKWGRANGWYLWALTDILLRLDSNSSGYSSLLSIYHSLVSAICRYTADSGLWHQVIDEPSTYEESSASCIFTFVIARGIRMGWLDETYRPIVRKAWDGIKSKITPDGQVLGICRSMSIQPDVDSYNKRETAANDPRGLGAFFMVAAETALINIL